MEIVRTTYRLTLVAAPFTLLLEKDGCEALRLETHLSADAVTQEENRVAVAFPDAALDLTLWDDAIDVQWQGTGIANAFPMTAPWYGQGELVHQRWPLNALMLPLTPLLTADNGAAGLLCIQTPAWLAANGIVILARSPVSVSINAPPDDAAPRASGFGLDAGPFHERPRLDPGGAGDGRLTLQGDDLHFEILIARDGVKAHAALVAALGRPTAAPPQELFTYPTWTTWARFKDRVNQTVVLDYAHEIIDHGYDYHVLEIDDRWQVQYGDLIFDPERFPDPRGMVDTLHELGFQVTAWTMPFLHPDSEAASEGAKRGFLVRTSQDAPYPIRWWQGTGYLLDATHPEALDWFGDRLRALQEATGLDGFKFDAGEALFLPEDAVTYTPLESRNAFTHHYVDWIARNFALCEVRAGWLNQQAPLFFRLWDLTSSWTHANGLRAVIPSALSLSITGYPFILPDMVGGNAYFSLPENQAIRWIVRRVIMPALERRARRRGNAAPGGGFPALPRFIERSPAFGYAAAELLIRWTQLNALLPALQFSLAPWEFGPECDALCKRYAALHTEFAPTLWALAQQATRTGEPIIRPLFWLAPGDPRALLCDDAYLVGDTLLVAPVVHAGQRARDVYLPPGMWRAYGTETVYAGDVVLEAYPAPLDALPLFERVAS